jgi:hypothetical protein
VQESNSQSFPTLSVAVFQEVETIIFEFVVIVASVMVNFFVFIGIDQKSTSTSVVVDPPPHHPPTCIVCLLFQFAIILY